MVKKTLWDTFGVAESHGSKLHEKSFLSVFDALRYPMNLFGYIYRPPIVVSKTTKIPMGK